MVEEERGSIYWVACEHFSELENSTFHLNKMEATQIEQLTGFSVTARILLSAVAGAVIQHLIDKGVDTNQIFEKGTFTISTNI